MRVRGSGSIRLLLDVVVWYHSFQAVRTPSFIPVWILGCTDDDKSVSTLKWKILYTNNKTKRTVNLENFVNIIFVCIGMHKNSKTNIMFIIQILHNIVHVLFM